MIKFQIKNRTFTIDEPTFGELKEFKSETGIDMLTGQMDSAKLNDSLKEFDGFIHIMAFLLNDENGEKIKQKTELEIWLMDNAGITDFRRLLENFTQLYRKDSLNLNILPMQETKEETEKLKN